MSGLWSNRTNFADERAAFRFSLNVSLINLRYSLDTGEELLNILTGNTNNIHLMPIAHQSRTNLLGITTIETTGANN